MDTKKAHQLLESFFATGKEMRFDRRSIIIGHGADPTHAYLITEGCVKVISYTGNGSERIQFLYGVGDLFPATWIFDQWQYDVGFTALTNVTLRQKPLGEVKQFFENEPYALGAMLDQQTAGYGRIINLNLGTAEQRMAYSLMTLAQRFGKREGDRYVVTLPFTVQELADMVRLTRETAGKVIAKFEQEGNVIFGRQQMLIYPDKLKKLAAE